MSAAQDEMDRRKREAKVRLPLREGEPVPWQVWKSEVDCRIRYEEELLTSEAARYELIRKFSFEAREVHPFEKNCLMGLHKLGLPYHGVYSGWDDKHRRPKTILICHECWLQRHQPLDPAVREEIDRTP